MNTELKNIFEDSGDYAAKWGISDFYDADGDLLEDTIKAGEPFAANWGAKKEIVYASIVSDGETIAVEVTASIDEFEYLLDSAIWEAEGKKDDCGSSTLSRLFGNESGKHYEQLQDACEFQYQESFTAIGNCKNDFETLTEVLDRLETEASDEAERCYQSIVESVKAYLEMVKADHLAIKRNWRIDL